MKKILFLSAMLFLGLNNLLQAQFIIGGNIGISAQKYIQEDGGDKQEAKITNVTLIPRLGYAFGNFWAGIDVGNTSVKVDQPDFGGNQTAYKVNLTNVGPFFRYIKKPTENFGIWVEGQAGFTFGKSEEDNLDVAKYSGINVGLRPGVIFMIGKHLTFEASFGRLGFTQTTITDANDSNQKETSSEFGLSMNNNSFNLSSIYFLEDFPLVLSNGFLFGANWTFGGSKAEK